MNLHRMLLERKAAGRPVTIGLIGAGKFGLMFLSQVRQTDGMHLVGVADLNTARARSQLKLGCWPEEQYAADLDRRRAQARPHHRHRQCRRADHPSCHRGDHRGDRRSRRRHPLRDEGDRERQAHRDGQCRGGRRRRPDPGAQGAAGRRGLFAGLGRPAGADRRSRRLGACGRIQGRRRRQGHALSPDLSSVDAGYGLGHPRQIHEDQGSQLDQSEDVQLVRRRHQVRHRDDRGVQRDRVACAERRPVLPARHALRARRNLQAEIRRWHAGEDQGSPR